MARERSTLLAVKEVWGAHPGVVKGMAEFVRNILIETPSWPHILDYLTDMLDNYRDIIGLANSRLLAAAVINDSLTTLPDREVTDKLVRLVQGGDAALINAALILTQSVLQPQTNMFRRNDEVLAIEKLIDQSIVDTDLRLLATSLINDIWVLNSNSNPNTLTT